MDELIDKINALQAQNIALMHGMATLLHSLPLDKTKLRKEYDARCAIFQTVMIERHAPDELAQQRKEFERVGNTIFQTS
jgi:hypothetical protein